MYFATDLLPYPSTPFFLRFAYQVTSKCISLLNLYACHSTVKFFFVLFCKFGFVGVTNSPVIKGGMHMISHFLGKRKRDGGSIEITPVLSRTNLVGCSKIRAFIFFTLEFAKSAAQFEVLKTGQRRYMQKTYVSARLNNAYAQKQYQKSNIIT